ncbi:hypothetical protein X953_07485 [Virgibacillus sp. SK37]|nr:hypothetical protein X953_07485 [Virgibacillus sp. SK37]
MIKSYKIKASDAKLPALGLRSSLKKSFANNQYMQLKTCNEQEKVLHRYR